MAIKRATTGNTSTPTVELARIRKGEAKTGNKPGAELEYFRVVWNEQSPYFQADPFLIDRCQDAWLELYGSEPKLLTGVQFVGNSIDTVFPNWFTEYKRGKSGDSMITRRCDGEHMERAMTGDGKTAFYGNLPEAQRPVCMCNPDERTCKPDAKLIFILPDFIRLTGVPGHFILITSSIVDVMNIYAGLEFAESALGRLQGVAFNLSREKIKIKGYVKFGCRLSMGDIAAQNAALQMSAAAGELPSGDYALPSGNGHSHSTAPALTAGTNGHSSYPDDSYEVVFKPQVEVKSSIKDDVITIWYGLTDVDGQGTYWTDRPNDIPIPFLEEFNEGTYTLDEVDTIPANMRGQVKGKVLFSAWIGA
jgi:hypothetical protein